MIYATQILSRCSYSAENVDRHSVLH